MSIVAGLGTAYTGMAHHWVKTWCADRQQGGYGFAHDQAWSCVVALSWPKRLGISVPDG